MNQQVVSKYFEGLSHIYELINDRKRVFVLSDTNTHLHCFPQLKNNLGNIEILENCVKAGETSKDISVANNCWKFLISCDAHRNDLLINLGGGMVCDLGGFIAATYKRGMQSINIPTTLLGMVDASWGGKCAINFDHLKNMIGVFNEPSAVIIDEKFLSTQDERGWKSGVVEMIKHGCIGDAKHFEKLKKANFKRHEISLLIEDSIKIKREIVKRDMREEGPRKALNFGHTIGHAIESMLNLNDEKVLHGEAVAAGLLCEAYIANKQVDLQDDALNLLIELITNNIDLPSINHIASDDLVNACRKDKKNTSSGINVTLIPEIGKAVIDQLVDEVMIRQSIDFYSSLKARF